jgi:hypothetical protein
MTSERWMMGHGDVMLCHTYVMCTTMPGTGLVKTMPVTSLCGIERSSCCGMGQQKLKHAPAFGSTTCVHADLLIVSWCHAPTPQMALTPQQAAAAAAARPVAALGKEW